MNYPQELYGSGELGFLELQRDGMYDLIELKTAARGFVRQSSEHFKTKPVEDVEIELARIQDISKHSKTVYDHIRSNIGKYQGKYGENGVTEALRDSDSLQRALNATEVYLRTIINSKV